MVHSTSYLFLAAYQGTQVANIWTQYTHYMLNYYTLTIYNIICLKRSKTQCFTKQLKLYISALLAWQHQYNSSSPLSTKNNQQNHYLNISVPDSSQGGSFCHYFSHFLLVSWLYPLLKTHVVVKISNPNTGVHIWQWWRGVRGKYREVHTNLSIFLLSIILPTTS